MKLLFSLAGNNFSAVSVMFTIIFLIVICFVMIEFMLAVTRWSYNNKQPIKTVFAIAKIKRRDSVNGTYFITFKLDDGSNIEYQVNFREYTMIDEETRGLLDYKGTRFIRFRMM